jgi:hypothetical protein
MEKMRIFLINILDLSGIGQKKSVFNKATLQLLRAFWIHHARHSGERRNPE